MPFVIKTAVNDPRAKRFVFAAQKTMYGGKAIAAGDEIFVLASKNAGGRGLIARGVVASVKAHTRPRGAARWTPRVSIEVDRVRPAKHPLGRDELKPWRNVKDGSPQAELDFKFYRQATDKICGISDETAAFLRTFF
ncbi:MAG TPA: hypothetical protein VIM02_14790 [Rhizomicrobium sp.]|jgi:hypothetical protein